MFGNKLRVPSSDTPIDHVFEEMGLVQFIDSGFPSFSPVGNIIRERVENVLVDACEQAGMDKITVPAIHRKDLVVQSGALEKYPDTFLGQDNLIVAGTSEEYALELAKKGLCSYKQLPISFYVSGISVRLVRRPKGMDVLREFSGVTMKSLNPDEDSFKESLRAFEELTEGALEKLGIPFHTAKKNSGVEFFYSTSDGRELSLGMGYRANPAYVARVNFNLADNTMGELVMGTFGIGLERVLLAAMDQNLRTEGVLLPPILTPFEGVVVPVKPENDMHLAAAEQVYGQREGYCLDDRLSLSVREKLDLADYLGIKNKILIGDREVGGMS